VFRGCLGGIWGVFRGCSGGVQGVFRGCSGGVQGVFRGCLLGIRGVSDSNQGSGAGAVLLVRGFRMRDQLSNCGWLGGQYVQVPTPKGTAAATHNAASTPASRHDTVTLLFSPTFKVLVSQLIGDVVPSAWACVAQNVHHIMRCHL